jgi:tRNA U55 pseudouridine synthase TruB
LTRTAIGQFTIDDARDVEQLTRDNLAQAMLPPQWAVQDVMPVQAVTPEEVARLANGLAIECPAQAADTCAAVDATRRLVAILERREAGQFGPAKYFPVE